MSARTCHSSGGTPAAAPAVKSDRLGRLQLLTYAAIRKTIEQGMTAHEVSIATGIDRHSIQPRISELRRKGLVITSGKRRRIPSCKTAAMWVAREYAEIASQSPDTT